MQDLRDSKTYALGVVAIVAIIAIVCITIYPLLQNHSSLTSQDFNSRSSVSLQNSAGNSIQNANSDSAGKAYSVPSANNAPKNPSPQKTPIPPSKVIPVSSVYGSKASTSVISKSNGVAFATIDSQNHVSNEIMPVSTQSAASSKSISSSSDKIITSSDSSTVTFSDGTKVSFKGYIVKFKSPSVAEDYAAKKKLLEAVYSILESANNPTPKSGASNPAIKSPSSVAASDSATIAVALKTETLSYSKKLDTEHVSAVKDMAMQTGMTEAQFSKNISKQFKDSINGVLVNLDDTEVAQLKKSSYVDSVSPNYAVHISLMDSVPLIGANKVWNITANGTTCTPGSSQCLTGKGVRIAIIDTGVDYTHPDLGGCFGAGCKVANGYDFVNNDNDPMDDMGHGTHVASIAAGKGVLYGVAPDATIYAYKVLDSSGSGYDSVIIEGIDAAMDPNGDGNLDDHVDVISMSLGGSGNPDDPMSQAIDAASDAGIVSVIAAGNNGPSSNTIGSPGTSRKAITVAATDKQDNLAYFSSVGPVIWMDDNGTTHYLLKPDISAPGVNICAAQSSEDTIWNIYYNQYGEDIHCLDDKHITLSGTSMATPHVAGVVALIKQAHPDWTPDDIKLLLQSSAVDVNYSYVEQGAGRVDAFKAATSPRPPSINLYAAENSDGNIVVSGDAYGNGTYELSYSGGDSPGGFTLLKTGNASVHNSTFIAIDPSVIGDGVTTFRLSIDTGNNVYEKRLLYYQNKIIIDNLQSNDIYRAGDNITIRGSVGYKNCSFTLSYMEDNVDKFVTGDIPQSDADGVLGNWDTSQLSSGSYSITIVVNCHPNTFQKRISEIYLDSTLRGGWPVHVNYLNGTDMGEKVHYWAGFLPPVVSDLNNDGHKEIITYIGGQPPELTVYNSDGSVKWSIPVAVSECSNYGCAGGNLHIPLVGDLYGDGKNEIIITVFSESENMTVYAYDGNGNLLWNNSDAPSDYFPTLMMADLKSDGNKEIILKGNNGMNRSVTIFDKNGKTLSHWYLPDISWIGSIVSSPAVGNFDNDSDLEIVVAGPAQGAGGMWDNNTFIGWNNTGEIDVYNMDGSMVPGWPVYTPGVIFSSPVVADVNNDGKEDIVVGLMYASDIFPEEGLGGLYAFDRNGSILPGWPQFKGYNFWSTPSIGDIYNDGKLEITDSRIGFDTYLLSGNGSTIDGWPQYTTWQDYYSSIRADVTGDGSEDVLTTAGNGFSGGGGVYAWDKNGSTISGFPKFTEVDAQAPAVVTDLDNDGKLELIASSDFDYDFANAQDKHRGSLYVWNLDSQVPQNMSWPTFMQNNGHTGRYLSSPAPIINITPVCGDGIVESGEQCDIVSSKVFTSPTTNGGFGLKPICDNAASYNHFCQNNGYTSGSRTTAYSGGSCLTWSGNEWVWLDGGSTLFNINCTMLGQKPCTPSSGGNCSYCDATCKQVVVTKPAPAVCGDGIVESGEQCDVLSSKLFSMPKVNIGYATLPVCDNSDSYNRFCQNNGYASGSKETAYSGGSCGLWNTTIGSWVQSSSVLFNINCVVQGQQPCTPTQNQSCTYCSNKCTDIIVCPSGTSWNYTSCQKNCPVQMGTDGGYAGCQGSYANIPNSIIDPSFYCPGGGHVASCFKCNSGYTWSGTYCNLTPPVVCGDGVCSSTETCKTCSTDCGLCSHTIVPIKD